MSDKKDKKKNGNNEQSDVVTSVHDAPTVNLSPPDELPTDPPVPPNQHVEVPADVTLRLKAAVAGAYSNEAAAAASLKDAKDVVSQAEHALCEHLKSVRGGSLKGIEIEVDGQKYKPKFIDETKRYRLDRVLAHERVTI